MRSSLADFLRIKKEIILLVIIVSAATLAVSTIVSIWLSRYHNLHFPSLGTIQVTVVEVYGNDINYTQDGVPFIDWGTVYPGMATNRSFYINNTGNTLVTLSLKISNLTFQDADNRNVTGNLPIESPLNLTWNYNNTVLGRKEEIYVTLTLTVSSHPDFIEYLIAYDVTKFTFDVVITPVEQH
jgi:hypothetical protein